MTNQNSHSKDAADLRQKAESLARKQAARTPEDSAALSPEEIRNILHELRVHQIELEMQNEELRAAQAELEESRSRYFDLYDLAPVSYCTLSEQGLILEANLTAATLLGTTRGALIKQPISPFILKEDQDTYYLHRKKLFETGESQECDLRLVKPDGTVFWGHLTATAAQRQDGAPVCRVVISDITKRKQDEEALERYKNIVSSTTDAIAYLDENYRYIIVNNAYEDFSRAKRDDFIGITVAEYKGKDVFEEKIKSNLERCLNGEIVNYQEWFEYPTKGKRFVDVTYFPYLDGKNHISGIIANTRDITERKQAEIALKESEKFLQILLESIPLPVFYKDVEGRYKGFNKAFETFFARPKSELIGCTVFDINPPELARIYHANDSELFKKISTQIYESQVKNAYGELRDVVFHKATLTDTSGAITGLVGAIMDITERKRAEEALQESLQRLEFALQGGNLGMWDWNPQDGAVVYNDLWAQMLEYRPDEVEPTVEFFKQHVHPEDLAVVLDRLTGHVEGRLPVYESEHRFRTKSGRWLWVLDRGKIAERGKDGRPVRVTGLIADITERKRAEGKLKRIEWMLSRKPVSDNDALTEPHDQGYGDLTELNRDGVILKSIGHERLKSFANEYLELLGTSSAIYEVNGDYAFGIFASGWCRMMDSASRKLCNTLDNVKALNSGRWLCHESCWSDCAKKAIANRAEVEIECSGGIRMYAVPIFAGGNVIGAINFGYGDPPKDPEKLKRLADVFNLKYDDLLCEATAYDSRPPYIIELAKKRLSSTAKLIGSMVETTQATEALKESEELLEITGRMARVGGWQLDVETMAVTWTKETYRIHEVPLNDKPPLDKAIEFFHPDDREALSQAIQQAMDLGKPYDMDLRFITAKGNKLWTRTICRPKVVDGKTVKLEGTFLDITERKQAEIERENLQAQLIQAQKMESIGTLAGGIAHDFNNILFPIIGHSEILMDDVPKDSPIQDSLKEIYTGALRAKDLVKQILAFARQEKNELKMMRMQPIIKEALKLIRSTIPTTIGISRNIQPDCGAVKADPTQIHQIVMNLATNAWHAMAETGGELIVNLKQIELNEYNRVTPEMSPGPYACLTVADTGTGMDQELIHLIFDPFFTTKEKGRGTGMGLSVIHGIVKSMNGTIQVYSQTGKGSEFHVYLPVVETVSQTQKIKTGKPIPGGMERILLVDDEAAIIALEKSSLSRLGYQVITCISSTQALEIFRSGSDQFDLVITDMTMPNISGDRLAGELIKIRPDIPILLCTGFSESLTDEKIKSLGIRGLLFKPLVIRDFAEKIRDVLDNVSAGTNEQ